jgi:hypothetical protein
MSEHEHHRKDDQPETIRQWYDRTTSKARMGLIWCCAISIVFGACFFAFAPLKLAQFMQTANGAVTIPIAGGIWIAAFVYIFLVPSREVGFRSQESIEQTQQILGDAVKKKIEPALEVWLRIGNRVETELNNGLMDQIKSTIKDLREATLKVTNSAETSNGEIKKFTEDAKPAIDALKGLNDKIDKNLGGDFVDNLKMAIESVKHMSLPPMDPGMPVQMKEPKIDKALSMISSSKQKPKPVIPAPPLAAPEAPASAPPPAIVVPAPAPAVAPPVPVVTPVAVPTMQGPVVVPAAAPVTPAPIPVMVPTPVVQNVSPVVTQPVPQAPALTPASPPASRFAPAPPPVAHGGPGSQQPVAMNSAPVQMVLPANPMQRQAPPPMPQKPAPELSGSRPQRSPRPGEVELPLNQKSRPVVVVPVAPQQMGVAVQNGPVPMVMAPQVIQRAEG